MGLYNPVGGALSELAQTARVIPAQIGQNELNRAELGLKAAGIERDIRNFEQFQKPKLEMEAAQLAEKKQPVTVGMFGKEGDPLTTMHLLQTPKDKPALYETIGEVLGAKANDKGIYVKPDGKPVERWEMEGKTGQLQRAMAIYMDPMKAVDTRKMELERAIAAPGVNPEWKAKAEASLEKLNGLTDADRLGIWENHQKRLLASRAPFIDNGGDAKIIDTELARVTGKINAIKDAATKQADREQGMEDFKEKERFKAGLSGESGESGPDWFEKEDYKSLQKQYEDVNELILGGVVEDGDIKRPMTGPEKMALIRQRNGLSRRMSEIKGGGKQVGGTYSAKPLPDEDANKQVDLIFGNRAKPGGAKPDLPLDVAPKAPEPKLPERTNLTPQERDKLVRDFIVNNPEVSREIGLTSQLKTAQGMERAAKTVIELLRKTPTASFNTVAR